MSDYTRPTPNPVGSAQSAARARLPMATMASLFSSRDFVAGILAIAMTLGPLAMAAFAVGRY